MLISPFKDILKAIKKANRRPSKNKTKASEVQELAESQFMTYDKCPSDINAMAKLGSHGMSPQNCNDELKKLFGKILKAPNPTSIKAPVLKKVNGQWVSNVESIDVFAPHDWFACCSQQGLVDKLFGSPMDIQDFWNQIQPNDPKFHKNEIRKIEDWAKLFLPIEFHGDAAPHQKHDSIDTNSFRSTLTILPVDIASLLLSAVPCACKATKKKCAALGIEFTGDTEEVLGKFLAWSFTAMFAGKHPELDADGKKFTDPYRASVAGTYLDPVHKRRCVIWTAPADNEHNVLSYKLPHYSSTEPCMDCACNTSDIPWKDFGKNALWRKCIYSAEDKFHCRDNGDHWLLSVPGFTPSTFGFDPMHCQEIGPSGTAVANVFFDLTKKVFTGLKSKRISKLNEEVNAAYEELGIRDNKIGRLLEYKHFCDDTAPFQNQPDFMHSVIKARQTRYLVPVAAKLCRKFHKTGDEYSTLRLKCLENLATSYDLVDRNGLFLGGDTEKYQQCISDFVSSYAALNAIAHRKDEKQWAVRPKLHYVEHIGDNALWMSPKATWAYRGESMVGSISALASSCLRNTAPCQVPTAVCAKYMIGKHLQFKFCM